MSKLLYKGTELLGIDNSTSIIEYDNTGSSLTATNIQAVIDEIVAKITEI